ncbi:uncharacterized protein B0J16DRAFT_391044 [Fusarium flagelliforme]|uniref:F-box domain-containing protein n=1 Tax=Fusarium flagelliforme TaxID=2675880 RepID=A0A395MPP7_9HYPO|nr:uncharacterized protein B0J16DRAFT_391044 [Fusarium flagelliforme]KAH7197267.1 hypothetical protein B0J16DRAFT_391044 [Fusarium flagelliforme]RFN49383.1 hypothetical protein FIE12Z_6365 [Fusarium flagelliforme]
MPGIGIESLPLFIYEEIAGYCDNKTLTQLVYVSVNFYNWFNGSRLKNFYMHDHLHLVTYWLRGLLDERSPRLVPRLKAIKDVEIGVCLGGWENYSLPRDPGYELPDLLVRLLSEMLTVKSATLILDCMHLEVVELLTTLLESKPSNMMKHSALDILALPQVTSAYLGCCDPSKLTSVYLYADRKVRNPEYFQINLAHGDYTMEYNQLLRQYQDQVPKLKRLRLALETDRGTSLKATFREIEAIATEFPELEWLIVDETGHRPDLMELESNLNWFADILSSTKLTHLAITIDNATAFESFQRKNPTVSKARAPKEFENWYQGLIRLLVESNPRLQRLVIIGSGREPFYNATRANAGVSVRHLNHDEMAQLARPSGFPLGLSG